MTHSRITRRRRAPVLVAMLVALPVLAAGLPLAEAWRPALDAYESLRPLGADRRLVPWLDATATIFGLDNWFRWVLVEGRRFERSARVVARVDRLLESLPEAVEWLRTHPAPV